MRSAAPSLPAPEAGEAGWVGMRTVADLRRALGVGAPRDADSLYRPIERAPRKFNPLKIPRALQARRSFVDGSQAAARPMRRLSSALVAARRACSRRSVAPLLQLFPTFQMLKPVPSLTVCQMPRRK